MVEGLTLRAWRTRLERRGHRTCEPTGYAVTGFTLWPTADTIITVATEADETLRPEYRRRFFLCAPEPEPVFRVMGCPEPHGSRWLELLSEQPASCWRDFLAGPGSWLLCRLSRFQRVVAWSDRGLPWTGLDNAGHRDWGMAVPERATSFFAPSDGPGAGRPRLLAVEDGRFADAVAACLLFGSVAIRDCYLADIEAREVYLAHHHDKVVVSIPAARRRKELLQDLREAAWLFTDVSGYGSALDEEEED